RFLQPLVDLPMAVGLSLGHACLAGVEQLESGIHRLAHGALGLRTEFGARLEGFVDGAGKLVVGHGCSGSFGCGLSGARTGVSSRATRAFVYMRGQTEHTDIARLS